MSKHSKQQGWASDRPQKKQLRGQSNSGIACCISGALTLEALAKHGQVSMATTKAEKASRGTSG